MPILSLFVVPILNVSILRFKAAAKVSDLVYPKASSVEVKMDDKESMTKEQIDARLKALLSGGHTTEDTEDYV